MKTKIALIGGGNMGEAMLAAWRGKQIVPSESITVSDISAPRRRYLADKFGVQTTADNRQAAAGAGVIVLTIKPQNLAAVMGELDGHLKAKQLVLSIIAGVRTETIGQGLRHQAIVRAMPNTPARIGEGVTVWTATPAVSDRQKKRAGAILGALGKEFYVAGENFLDMATAVSGSGPAYLFYFVEALAEAAAGLGFSPGMAEELVLGTVLGSVHLLQKSGEAPTELRRQVTSPGGTTAEALRTLEEGKFKELIARAVQSAHEKAQRLGGK